MYYTINSKFKLLKNNRIKTFYIYAKEEKDIQHIIEKRLRKKGFVRLNEFEFSFNYINK